MIRLGLLGPLALLHEDGTPVRSLLAQPKRFALLAYLASSGSSAAHRRDTLLGLFWPELDEAHARNALRQALHRLRHSLGPGVIVGEGDELVGVDKERLWCDAAAFSAAAESGREEEALDLYRGPFLEGFHLSGVPTFERWMEGEDRRLRRAAVEAAWRLAERAVDDRPEARKWAERALDLAPYDEEGLRRYLSLMAEQRQPAAAVRAYEAYAERLKADLGLEPSTETVELAERVRAGEGSAGEVRPGGPEGERPAKARIPAPASLAPAGEPPRAGPSPVEPTATSSGRTGGERPRRPAGPEDPEESPDPAHRKTWKLAAGFTCGVVLLAAVGWAVLGTRAASSATGPTEVRLAVLPLANLTGDPAQDYFVAGMHDALVSELGKIGDLMMVSRQSVLRYQESDEPLPAIARELGVDAIVEGSVFLAADSVRITAQLVRAVPEQHLWAESYRGALAEALALQGEVARSVARAVHASVTPETEVRLASAHPVMPGAQEAYLRGLYHLERASYAQAMSPADRRDGHLRAIAYLEQAVALDPDWTAAHARLALAYHWMASFRYPWSPSSREPDASEFWAKSKAAALRALELDENESQAHASLGFVLGHERNWAEAERAFTRALELDPNSHHWAYATYLQSAGRHEEAIAHYRQAEARNPLSDLLKWQVAFAYDCAGRLDEAIEQTEELEARMGGPERATYEGWRVGIWTRPLIAFALSRKGEHEAAIEIMEEYVAMLDSLDAALTGLAYVYALAARHDEARELLGPVEARVTAAHGVFRPAQVYAALGETERALAIAEEWVEANPPSLGGFLCSHTYRLLKQEPRMQAIVRRLRTPT